MTPPDAGSRAVTDAQLAALADLPREDGEPLFGAPWQAQAFALAVQLSQAGYFTWGEWVETFARLRSRAAREPAAEVGAQYYARWLEALEELAVRKGLCDRRSLALRRDAWERAYVQTPHGQPVRLSAGC